MSDLYRSIEANTTLCDEEINYIIDLNKSLSYISKLTDSDVFIDVRHLNEHNTALVVCEYLKMEKSIYSNSVVGKYAFRENEPAVLKCLDLGQTAILGDVCSKGSLRIDTYGTIDELLCALGVIYSSKNINLSIRRRVYEIVEILFEINVVLASFEYKEIDLSEKVCDLEYDIDSMSKKLSILTKFIVPYGNDSFHKLNNARVITRRAERLCVKLREEVDFSLSVLKYLNRLSDYLFICSRYCNDNEKYFK